MKRKTLLWAGACALVLLAASSCAKARYPNYYTLGIAPTLQPIAGNVPRSVTVSVRRFQTPEYLRQGRIVYRQTVNEVGFYDYHRWATDPGATVTAAVVDTLRSAQLFSFVKSYDGQDRAGYLMRGKLERLDEIDYGGQVRVEAKVSAELVDMKTGVTVWTGVVSQSSRVETRTIDSVVGEMSHTLQIGINQLVESMSKQLSVADAQVQSAKIHNE